MTEKAQIECAQHLLADNLDIIAALADALEVLTALERTPVHQDTHPSHNIRTGGGYAGGRRVAAGTMPRLLAYIGYLATDTREQLDELFGELGGEVASHD